MKIYLTNSQTCQSWTSKNNPVNYKEGGMWKSHGSYLRREWKCWSYEGHRPGVLQQSLKGLEPFRGTALMFAPNAGSPSSITGQGTRSHKLQLGVCIPQLKSLHVTTKIQRSQIHFKTTYFFKKWCDTNEVHQASVKMKSYWGQLSRERDSTWKIGAELEDKHPCPCQPRPTKGSGRK